MASLEMVVEAKERDYLQMFANNVEDEGIGLESALAVLSDK